MKHFYTFIHDSELELLLEQTTADLAAEIQTLPEYHLIDSVVMGGGYGRAEGGVRIDADKKHHPYNDLDFFVFTRNRNEKERAAVNAALLQLADKYAKKLGIDVDFAFPRNLKDIGKVSSTQMYQEFRSGHKILLGSSDFLAEIPIIPPEKLSKHEGVRQLLNRGAGILFGFEHLKHNLPHVPEAECDFIYRNCNKGVFGSIDALLIAKSQYSYSLEERLEKVGELFPEFYPAYFEAFEFKIRPYFAAPEILSYKLQSTLELWKKCVAIFAGEVSGKVIHNSLQAIPAIKCIRFQVWKNLVRNLILFHQLDIRSGQCRSLELLIRMLAKTEKIFDYETPAEYNDFLTLWRKFN